MKATIGDRLVIKNHHVGDAGRDTQIRRSTARGSDEAL
jgi:Domain of unknown function (DUF1918)